MRDAIDTLKQDAAIWKKEVWADGSGTWVHPVERPNDETRNPNE